MYEIICVSPLYDWNTDAIIGSKYTRLPMTYFNMRLAQKIAGRLSDIAWNECGDDHFIVVPYGKSAQKRIMEPPPVYDDYPF